MYSKLSMSKIFSLIFNCGNEYLHIQFVYYIQPELKNWVANSIPKAENLKEKSLSKLKPFQRVIFCCFVLILFLLLGILNNKRTFLKGKSEFLPLISLVKMGTRESWNGCIIVQLLQRGYHLTIADISVPLRCVQISREELGWGRGKRLILFTVSGVSVHHGLEKATQLWLTGIWANALSSTQTQPAILWRS